MHAWINPNFDFWFVDMYLTRNANIHKPKYGSLCMEKPPLAPLTNMV